MEELIEAKLLLMDITAVNKESEENYKIVSEWLPQAFQIEKVDKIKHCQERKNIINKNFEEITKRVLLAEEVISLCTDETEKILPTVNLAEKDKDYGDCITASEVLVNGTKVREGNTGVSQLCQPEIMHHRLMPKER